MAKAILIRVRNPAELARKQGGAAAIAQMLAPNTVDEKIHATIADRLRGALRNEGVDAEISIVEPDNVRPAGMSNWWKYLAIGLGAIGAGYVGYRVVKR
jgi:hypothetical protein